MSSPVLQTATTGSVEDASLALRAFDRPADANRAVPAAAIPILSSMLESVIQQAAEGPVADILAGVEAMAFESPTLAHAALSKVQAAVLVIKLGTREQRAAALPAFTSAATLTPLLMTESNGRGPTEWDTAATATGDEWTIHGRKLGVHGGPGKPAVIVARTPDGGIQSFLLDEGTGGAAMRVAAPAASLALGASRLSTVELSDLRVKEAARMSGADASAMEAARAVGVARLLLGAVSLGTAAAAMAYAQSWATTRHAFGKPLAAFEGVAFDIADHDTRLSMARLTLSKAAHNVGHSIDAAAIDDLVGRTLARVTSLSAAAAIDGVQLLGVHGIIHEHPQELFHRTASSLSTLDTDPLRGGFRLL
jgi:alkylation response protein AidB-like acyl-CoA dehydrogenase